MGRPTKRFGFGLDQCVGRREKAAIAEDAFAVEWVGDGEREELGFEHDARLRALLGGEWQAGFFGAGHILQARVVKEDALALTALHDEERGPLLIEAAAFAIDEAVDGLQLCTCGWRA